MLGEVHIQREGPFPSEVGRVSKFGFHIYVAIVLVSIHTIMIIVSFIAFKIYGIQRLTYPDDI